WTSCAARVGRASVRCRGRTSPTGGSCGRSRHCTARPRPSASWTRRSGRRRLVTRARSRFQAALRRLRSSAVPILQCGIAAGGAWLVASDLIGHEHPFFSPIAAVISLGVSLANRLQRAVELVLGVTVGVLVGDLIISVIGSG